MNKEALKRVADKLLALSPEELRARLDKTGEKMLKASKTDEFNWGNAFVLLKKGRRLYEVNASHCSCNGLEDQWCPEMANKKALLIRRFSSHLNEFVTSLYKFLKG